MNYTVVDITLAPVDPYRDLLIYALGDEGPYDSFEETRNGLRAYIQSDLFDAQWLQDTLDNECTGCSVDYAVSQMPDRNWNEEWERQHKPVLVDNFCWIRAPFHPHRSDVQYEIEIEPKMSFGTGHHQTTYMMLSLLRDETVEGRRVLDMGSGTAVLAILASMQGAATVTAIDNDEWAYRNTLENIKRNQCSNIECLLGDASLLTADRRYDIILANINRNILLHDMEAYVSVLNSGGVLLLSGFYQNDVAMLTDKARSLGLTPSTQMQREGWQALRFVKH